MKILTKKKQAKLLNELTECQILVTIIGKTDVKLFSEITKILAEITYDVAGLRGLEIVPDMVHEELNERLKDE